MSQETSSAFCQAIPKPPVSESIQDPHPLTGMRYLNTWLFNPFYFIAGGQALVVGLIAIVFASSVGWISESHFDGVLDFHTGAVMPFWVYLVEGIINWLSLSVALTLAGFVISSSQFRVVDIFGTQALARFPSILTAEVGMLTLYPGFREQLIRLTQGSMAFTPAGVVIMVVLSIVIIATTIWMLILMYRAFAVSCNVKGAKAITTFIAMLLIGEIISKVALSQLYTHVIH